MDGRPMPPRRQDREEVGAPGRRGKQGIQLHCLNEDKGYGHHVVDELRVAIFFLAEEDIYGAKQRCPILRLGRRRIGQKVADLRAEPEDDSDKVQILCSASRMKRRHAVAICGGAPQPLCCGVPGFGHVEQVAGGDEIISQRGPDKVRP